LRGDGCGSSIEPEGDAESLEGGRQVFNAVANPCLSRLPFLVSLLKPKWRCLICSFENPGGAELDDDEGEGGAPAELDEGAGAELDDDEGEGGAPDIFRLFSEITTSEFRCLFCFQKKGKENERERQKAKTKRE